MPILKLQNIDKKFHQAEAFAVQDISFEVEEGEILALVGESGSGKTTLLRLIAGLEHPDNGHIYLSGEKIVEGPRSLRPHERQVGLVFQDYALFPHLNILENVKFGLKSKLPNRDEVARSVLKLVNLKENDQKYPHQLSGGQQQRVALARAIAPNPKILLMDEPFSNLDALLKDQVREEIRQIIKKAGITAIFVTHDTRDALSTADRIAILHEGHLLQIDHPRNLYEKPVNAYVANFFGKQNKILGKVTENGFMTTFGFISDETASSYMGEVLITFRPEHAITEPNPNQKLIGNLLKVAYFGDHQLIKLADGKGQFINIKVPPDQSFLNVATQCFSLLKYEITPYEGSSLIPEILL
jgi:iron(III) transport system ATP-binding protein